MDKGIYMNLSPDETVSLTDPGDEVQKRFRYQHAYTVLVAIKMLSDSLEFKEILCEQHEDVLGVCDDQKFVGIQIKTKDTKDGLFRLTDNAIRGSLARFIKLNKDFPEKFSKFIIVSNCGFKDDDTELSPVFFINEAKRLYENQSYIFSQKKFDKEFQFFINECNVKREDVLYVLSLVNLQQGPGIDDIDSKIIHSHLGKLDICANYNLSELNGIYNNLLQKVYTCSSKILDEPIKDYASLANGEVDVSKAIINSKRITKREIGQIIQNEKNKFFLDFTNGVLNSNNNFGNKNRLITKMSCGLIENEDIEIMNDLRDSAESFFLEAFHRNDPDITNRFKHVKGVVLNQAREAKSRCRKQNENYGIEMLHSLEDRLLEITKFRQQDVFEYPYELLKGIVGILTSECNIDFSEKPVGGWNFNE